MSSFPATSRGFTLLEVVAAFAVSTLLLAALLPAVVSSLDRLDELRTRSAALRVARSVLERHAALARFEEGTHDGREGELFWRVQIEPLLRDTDDGTTGALVLRRIRVEVATAAREPLVSLSTYRTGGRR